MKKCSVRDIPIIMLVVTAFVLYIGFSTSHVVADTTCSGNQAGNESDDSGTLYIKQGQTFHVNINLPGISNQQLTDIQNGINSWAGTSGISIVYDSSTPGPGVITVNLNSAISEVGYGFWAAGGGSLPGNQITGGTISFNFGFKFACSTGSCLAYDPNAPNADNFLTGVAAHEMGHILGLDNTSDSADPCTQTSTSVMGGACGTNNNGDGMSKPAPTSTSPTSCDKQNIAVQTTAHAISSPPGGGTSRNNPPVPVDGASGSGSGSTGGGSCAEWTDWDDTTYTLTLYSSC